MQDGRNVESVESHWFAHCNDPNFIDVTAHMSKTCWDLLSVAAVESEIKTLNNMKVVHGESSD